MTFENKRLTAIIITIAILLLIPFFAMQFTNEVNWSFYDFIVAGGLLFGTGFTGELVLRRVKKTAYRVVIITAILLLLLVVWAEIAVGIFGTPLAGN